MRKILLALAACLLLGGCDVGSDLSQLAVVSSLGIEKKGEGLHLTCEVGQQTHGEYQAKGRIVTAEGVTLPEALEQAAQGSLLQLSHVELLVVSEEAAKGDLRPMCEYWIENPQLGLSSRFMVARGASIDEVLTGAAFEGEIPGLGLQKLLWQEYLRGNCPYATFMQIKQEEHLLAPVVIVRDEKVEIDGSAVFTEGTLSRYFDREITRGLMMIRNEKGKLLFSESEGQAAKIKRYRMHLEATEEGGSIQINLLFEADVQVVQGKEDSVEGYLRTLILNSIEEAQATGIDVLRFDKTVQRTLPRVWEEAEDSWDAIFPTVPVNLTMDITIE